MIKSLPCDPLPRQNIIGPRKKLARRDTKILKYPYPRRLRSFLESGIPRLATCARWEQALTAPLYRNDTVCQIADLTGSNTRTTFSACSPYALIVKQSLEYCTTQSLNLDVLSSDGVCVPSLYMVDVITLMVTKSSKRTSYWT
jgi:hypothetical protein